MQVISSLVPWFYNSSQDLYNCIITGSIITWCCLFFITDIESCLPKRPKIEFKSRGCVIPYSDSCDCNSWLNILRSTQLQWNFMTKIDQFQPRYNFKGILNLSDDWASFEYYSLNINMSSFIKNSLKTYSKIDRKSVAISQKNVLINKCQKTSSLCLAILS